MRNEKGLGTPHLHPTYHTSILSHTIIPPYQPNRPYRIYNSGWSHFITFNQHNLFQCMEMGDLEPTTHYNPDFTVTILYLKLWLLFYSFIDPVSGLFILFVFVLSLPHCCFIIIRSKWRVV